MKVYSVTIDFGQTLAEMIEAGRYDSCDEDITPEHFPLTGEGKVTAQLELANFWPDNGEPSEVEFESDDALKKLQQLGLEPAKLEHLLAYGAQHWHEGFVIVAAGTVWVDQRERPIPRPGPLWVGQSVSYLAPQRGICGARYVPCLSIGSKRERGLNLISWDGAWDGWCSFLGVRREPLVS